MADRAKVIYDLERCICHVPDACRDCSKYNAEGNLTLTCMESLMKDALELLKEQEPVRFKVTQQCRSYPFWDAECSGCGYKTSTIHTNWKYCPECGRKVKWDG